MTNILDRAGLYGENELHDSIQIEKREGITSITQSPLNDEKRPKKKSKNNEDSHPNLSELITSNVNPEATSDDENKPRNLLHSFQELASQEDGSDKNMTGTNDDDEPSEIEYSTFGGNIDFELANSDAYNPTQEKVDLNSLSKSANIFRKNKNPENDDDQDDIPDDWLLNKNNKLFQNEHADEKEDDNNDDPVITDNLDDKNTPNFGAFTQAEDPNVFGRDSFGIQTRQKPDVVNSKETSLMKLLKKPEKSEDDQYKIEPIKEEGEYQELKNDLKNNVNKKVKNKIEDFLTRKLDNTNDEDLLNDIKETCDDEFDKQEKELNITKGGSLSFRDIKSLRSVDIDMVANNAYDLLLPKIEKIKEDEDQEEKKKDLSLIHI